MTHSPIERLRISAYTVVTALGAGVPALASALHERRSGLRRCDLADAEIDTFIGRIDGLDEAPIEGALASFDCRNNRLARLALSGDGFAEAVAAARARHGAARVGLFLGTSTSGIRQTEQAYAARDAESGRLPDAFDYRHTHNLFSLGDYVGHALALEGPSSVIATACSSSAKVFAAAHRSIAAGFCDAAVVGGVDSLCLTTLYGFRALELTSSSPCRPWDAARDGLSLGEAGGFALLERAAPGETGVGLLGYGESSDAYHMTAAHPEGARAALAMRKALASAGLAANDIDYINLHGTATPLNDAAEDRAVTAVFGDGTPCSSTKGWTGHALGASGMVEAAIALTCIETGLLPGSLNTRTRDPALSADVLIDNREQPVARVMSNSFGFGGTNCSLIFGRLG